MVFVEVDHVVDSAVVGAGVIGEDFVVFLEAKVLILEAGLFVDSGKLSEEILSELAHVLGEYGIFSGEEGHVLDELVGVEDFLDFGSVEDVAAEFVDEGWVYREGV